VDLDEEGDQVKVGSEDEFQTFIQSVLDGRFLVCDASKPVEVRPVIRKKSKLTTPSLSLVLADEDEDEEMDATPMDPDLTGLNRSQRVLLDAEAASTSLLSVSSIRSEDLHPITVLGSGHSGSVYKALDIRNDRFVAVKSIALDVSAEMKEQILSEMNILYQCKSPFIIGFYGADFVDNRIAIYTEFMDGGSIEHAIKRLGKAEEPVLRAVAVAVVRGLCYLWNMKIMHRDVKPSNILVNSSGDVKLCDFGVSVQLVNSIAKSYVGTSVYMAPERLLGNEYTIRSDVWSLGLSLMEMALGRFPYFDANSSGQRPVAVLESIVNHDPPTLDAAEFTAELREFLSLCLHKMPEKRPTFDELSHHSLIVSSEPFNRPVIAEWVSKLLANNA